MIKRYVHKVELLLYCSDDKVGCCPLHQSNVHLNPFLGKPLGGYKRR